MRSHVLASLVFGAALGCSVGVGGCTTILGDFEIQATAVGVDDGGAPDATSAECTVCGSECVDLQTNKGHCGACGVVCSIPGQECSAGVCGCPGTTALCNGQCVKSDRGHCGPTCSACLDDEICGTKCVPAPSAEFVSTPADPTGWTVPGGTPIEFKIKPTNVPGTIYECRSGPAPFTQDQPEWKPCDGAAGSEPIHRPTPLPAQPAGSYRAEYRYRSDTYRSNTVAFDFYVHPSLDGVPTCPRPGHPEDGPKFSDAAYFAAAEAYNPPGGRPPFDKTGTFPAPGASPSDAVYLRNPRIKIPFVGVKRMAVWSGGWNDQSPGQPTFDYVFEELSLRHKFVFSPTRNLLLVRRSYVNPNPVKKDCRNEYAFGNASSGDAENSPRTWGPDGVGRGRKVLDCEALVLNVHGAGLCMGRNAQGTAPAPLAIDRRPAGPDASNNYGNAVSGVVTAGGLAGTNTVTLSTTSGIGNGYYIQVATNDTPPFRWYKVTKTPSAGVVTVEPNFYANVPIGSAVRAYYGPYITGSNYAEVVIPTAVAKLHPNTHKWKKSVIRPPPNELQPPLFGTKCVVEGCATGRPWLMYLPP